MSKHSIIILGGGAAGFFAAIHNKEANPNSDVIIIEQSSIVLSKVKISGGGRCNVTHACFEPKELVSYYPRGGKALHGLFSRFQPQDTMEWFESRGVKLKIEADNRVFPVSDSSQSIIDCLLDTAQALGIKIWTKCRVESVNKQDHLFNLNLADGQTIQANKLIMATGSSRFAYDLAASFGHTIVKPLPSLFTVKINDKALTALSGISVPAACASLYQKKKTDQIGPLLITHQGLSGPAIIKLSAWQAVYLAELNYTFKLRINWLSLLSQVEIMDSFIDVSERFPDKLVLSVSPFPDISTRLWHYLVSKTNFSQKLRWKQVSEKHMTLLLEQLTATLFDVVGKSPFKEEFVTCGGVELNEVNFKNMESRLCPGLHFVGELLNIDGVTGGFNFQNAWSTGVVSGNI